MDTFMVQFELPPVGDGEMGLDAAFVVAQRIIDEGMARAYPQAPRPLITVSMHVERIARADRPWSVTVSGDQRSSKGKEFTLAFSMAERRGAAMISDAAAPEPTTTTVYLRPASISALCRHVMGWPLDMIDEMAREDEARRRGGGR